MAISVRPHIRRTRSREVAMLSRVAPERIDQVLVGLATLVTTLVAAFVISLVLFIF
jgi:hypothetical protein